VRRSADLTVDAVRQHRVIAVGAASSAVARKAAANELTLAVSAAQDDLTRAGEELAVARDEAEERAQAARLAEERRLAEEQLRASGLLIGDGSGPLPPVDGKVCPIGAPNAFIDSWGFPRSGGRRHQGVDVFAAYGTPLYAVADGTITRVANGGLGGLTLHLVDDRGDDYYYAHLSAVAVQAGQRVTAGQIVGANGNTGNAATTPPHLHWQYHPAGGPPVNPYALTYLLCRSGAQTAGTDKSGT
jgi:peptidoglycan LD-endopeptidase LytH